MSLGSLIGRWTTVVVSQYRLSLVSVSSVFARSQDATEMRSLTWDSIKSGVPIGEPRRKTPDGSALGIPHSRGSGLSWKSWPTQIRHLSLLRKRPRDGPSSSRIAMTRRSSFKEPQIVPSSMIQMFAFKPETSALIFSMRFHIRRFKFFWTLSS